MASQIDICNRALLSIGARAQVSSISPSDGSTEANACAILFAPTFEALARAAYWNCLRQQAALSVLAAATGTPENPGGTTLPQPPTPWLYSYADPSDSLNLRFIVPSLPSTGTGGAPLTTLNNAAGIAMPNGGQIPFAVAYATDSGGNPIRVVLTNQEQAQAVYTVNQPNPVIWDSLFQEAMVASLAAYLVPALTGNVQLMQLQVARAQALIARARAADGDEGVTVMDHLPDWMRARNGGVLEYWSQVWTQTGYIDMAWPAG